MAELIGGLGTSHVPSIGVALDKGQSQTDYWKPLFDGYDYPKQWMKENRPDIAVVIFNDHGNAIFLDRVPTFTVGVAAQYAPADEARKRMTASYQGFSRCHAARLRPRESVGSLGNVRDGTVRAISWVVSCVDVYGPRLIAAV